MKISSCTIPILYDLDFYFSVLPIQTERLIIRLWEPATDAPFIFEFTSNKKSTRFTGGVTISSIAEQEDILYRSNYLLKLTGLGIRALYSKDHSRVIGYCGFLWLEDTPWIEVVYGLVDTFEHRGFAFEAALHLLHRSFSITNISKIVAIGHTDNVLSVNLLHKLGMIYESEYYYRSVGYTGNLYSITRGSFLQNHGIAFDYQI